MSDSVTRRLSEITGLLTLPDGRKILMSFEEGSLVTAFPDPREVPMPGLENYAWFWEQDPPEFSITAVKNPTILPSEPFLKRWHRPIEDLPDRYHTYCPKHPEWGVCERLPDAYRAIADHLEKDHA